MKPQSFVALVGALLIVAGVIVGLTVSATVLTPSTFSGSAAVSCGPTFSGMGNLSVTPLGTSSSAIRAQCDAASGPAVFVWLLIGLGVVALIGAMFIKPKPAVASQPA